jgi:hypothetical protein
MKKNPFFFPHRLFDYFSLPIFWLRAYLMKLIPETRGEYLVWYVRQGGRRGRHCMVIGFTTTCKISAYNH